MKAMEFRGRWVLVTGASSGLGQQMARLLAVKYGANLIVVARRIERLAALKAELEAHAPVRVSAFAADLALLTDVDRVIEQATSGRELYGAILNAGTTHFGPYADLPWDQFKQMLDTNVTGVVRMATSLIPHLEQSGGGLMLVSSMAGLHPVPYQTAYSATKAFLLHFGVGLWHELKGRNLSITNYAPGGVATEMTAGNAFQPLQRWLMNVKQASREGVEAFRLRKYLHIPGLTNRLSSALARLLPRQVATEIVAAQYRNALQTRRKT